MSLREILRTFAATALLAVPLIDLSYGFQLNTHNRLVSATGLESKVANTIVSPTLKSKEPKAIDYRTDDFNKDSNEVLLARMIYGEARNCSKEEKIEIAYSAINRVNDGKKWNGETLREVILKPWQYSCFNKNDVNYEKLKAPEKKVFEDCLKVADGVLEGKYSELNLGQTHYFNPKSANPKWTDKMKKIGKIGNSKHEFYTEK